MPRSDVQEMDSEPVNVGTKLRKRIDPSFERTPVISVAPPFEQRLCTAQRGPLPPVADGFPLRPSSRHKPALEIVDCNLGHHNRKWGYSVSSCQIMESRFSGH